MARHGGEEGTNPDQRDEKRSDNRTASGMISLRQAKITGISLDAATLRVRGLSGARDASTSIYAIRDYLNHPYRIAGVVMTSF